VACPYFFPKERTFSIGWAFPRRLPLGAGFCGTCRAGGEEVVPDDATLRDLCNLGHAHRCSRMPSPLTADSLRFAVARDAGGKIVLHYVFDREHAPAGHGQLAYDCAAQRWISTLDDVCAQRQAECYLAAYLERRRR
jgi:hypothetical protein